MNTYSSYKDSGIEWMGNIPESWELTKNRFGFLKHKNGLNESDDTNVLSLTTTGVKVKRDLNFGKSSESYIGHQLVEQGDIVFTPRDFDQTPILSDVSKYEGCISNLYIVDKTKENVLNRYVNYYWYGLKYSVDYFKNFSHGMRYSFNRFQFDEIPLLIPSLREQQQISDYLDYKTSKIDILIEKTQQKIELLKEQRTSLINTTVTKGLDPNVEMKDSGVEWIGDIPSGWGVKPLKYVAEYNLSSLGNNTDPEYKLNYLEISDVDSLGNIKKPTKYTFSKSPSRCRRIVQKDDIIISTVRTYLKSIGFIKNEVKDLICSTGFCVITPNKTIIIPSILFYMVRMESFISTVISSSVGVSYPSINSDKLVGVKILIPPLQEQQQIVDYLDLETSKIDKLVNIESKRINLLKEYRQSLISEVVTGKVDVRDEVLL
jgi:type I restriction enzyme, S subunit